MTLQERILQEFYDYGDNDCGNKSFKNFKKTYNNFKGKTFKEFLNMSEFMYREWCIWKKDNDYGLDFKIRFNSIKNKRCKCVAFLDIPTNYCDHKIVKKTFKEVFREFKKDWNFDDLGSAAVFKEMECLSNGMLIEWRKYKRDNTNKDLPQLWQEFKKIWEIDPENYDETLYKEMDTYVLDTWCGQNKRDDFPKNFCEYLEYFDYYNFQRISIVKQFEICRDWDSEV